MKFFSCEILYFCTLFLKKAELEKVKNIIRRMLNSRGYGIQSPYAYTFLLDVVRQENPYYDYARLHSERTYTESAVDNTEEVDKLLFRISNFVQPDNILVPEGWVMSRDYLSAGCRKSAVMSYADKDDLCQLVESQPILDMVCMDHLQTAYHIKDRLLSRISSKSIFIIKNIRQNPSLWQELQTEDRVRQIFDLYNWGIVFFNPVLTRGKYFVNAFK